MNLFKNLKRFGVGKLFVRKIFAADNLRYKSYFGMISKYYSLYTPRFLGIKILYGNGKTLKDPIYDTKYVATVNALEPKKIFITKKFYFKRNI